MERLEKLELIEMTGGFNLTGVLVREITNAGKAIYDLGRSLGTSIRRLSSNKLCPLR